MLKKTAGKNMCQVKTPTRRKQKHGTGYEKWATSPIFVSGQTALKTGLTVTNLGVLDTGGRPRT